MGRPKALLTLDGLTFLQRWLDTLAAAKIEAIRVVLGRDGAAIRATVALDDARVVLQSRPQEGMLSSLRLGLAALPEGLAGAFLCPVDQPRVPPALLIGMRDALRPGHVVLPVHGGRRGHPVLFARELFDELMAAPLEAGARAVVRADPARVIEIEAGAPVLDDVDTPGDYQNLTRG